MPSDMREAVAAVIERTRELHCAKPSYAIDDETADAALAVIRERLAEKVPEQFNVMNNYDRYDRGQVRGHNACRAAMLRELGGEE